MSVQSASAPAAPQPRVATGPVAAGLLAFGVLELLLALAMAASPHAFFRAIGPFGAYNAHYIRDVASFEAAIGVVLLIALRRPSWRVPALALATIQFALHSLNHLLDIGRAHPLWTGYFDFFSLAAATVVLGWLWHRASVENERSAS